MSQLTIIGNFAKTRTTDSWCILTPSPAMHNRHQLATVCPTFILQNPKQRRPGCWKINVHNSNQSPGGPGGSGRGRGGGGGRGGGNWNRGREYGEGGELAKRHHHLYPENLKRNTVGSILSEWMKSKKVFPSYLRYPSFLSVIHLLTHARLDENLASIKGAGFIWCLIRNLCRSFLRRIVRDKHFTKKLIFQFVASASFSLWWEFEGRRKKSESFVSSLASALTMATTQCLVVWLLAPESNNFSPKSEPNSVFEATKYVYKKLGVGQRMLCLVRCGTNLFMLGMLVKAAEAVVNGDQAGFHRSAAIILGNGMFFGFDCNFRYQILCGLDRMMVDYFGDTKFTLALCAIFRALNAWIGAERSLKYALSSQPEAKTAAA